MFQGTPKLVILSIVCVLSVVALLVVSVRAMLPDEPSGLRAGTWTSTGPAESMPDASATQAGDAQLGELVSFVIEASSQESPFVNVTLTYRDGNNVALKASSEMQEGYLQANLRSPTGAGVPVTFRNKGNSEIIEVSDGHLLARFAQ